MMEIIICDDNDEYRHKIVELVETFMKTSGVDCEIQEFDDYDDSFLRIINQNTQRIYILDIETPSRSGIDVARMIRKNDFQSIIIFVTGHEQLGQLVLKRNIMCLAFINKFDNLTKSLREALKEAVDFLNTDKVLRVVDNGITYTIRFSNILYITTDCPDRRIVIKTDKTEYKLKSTLYEIKKQLGDKFIQTYRSCFVNETRVEKIDSRKKTITFDNGLVIDLLSDTYRKSIIK